MDHFIIIINISIKYLFAKYEFILNYINILKIDNLCEAEKLETRLFLEYKGRSGFYTSARSNQLLLYILYYNKEVALTIMTCILI